MARVRGHLLLGAAILAGVLVLARAVLVEPFSIPTSSMSPTLRPGDHVLVDKLSYRLGSPHRGDLAVFNAPDAHVVEVKRIVGVGGDRVAIEDGVLVVNGHRRHEPYVDLRMTDSMYFGPVRVPRGHLFMLGDNRADSHDSRAFGSIARRALIGHVLLRVWPLSR